MIMVAILSTSDVKYSTEQDLRYLQKKVYMFYSSKRNLSSLNKR